MAKLTIRQQDERHFQIFELQHRAQMLRLALDSGAAGCGLTRDDARTAAVAVRRIEGELDVLLKLAYVLLGAQS